MKDGVVRGYKHLNDSNSGLLESFDNVRSAQDVLMDAWRAEHDFILKYGVAPVIENPPLRGKFTRQGAEEVHSADMRFTATLAMEIFDLRESEVFRFLSICGIEGYRSELHASDEPRVRAAVLAAQHAAQSVDSILGVEPESAVPFQERYLRDLGPNISSKEAIEYLEKAETVVNVRDEGRRIVGELIDAKMNKRRSLNSAQLDWRRVRARLTIEDRVKVDSQRVEDARDDGFDRV